MTVGTAVAVDSLLPELTVEVRDACDVADFNAEFKTGALSAMGLIAALFLGSILGILEFLLRQ